MAHETPVPLESDFTKTLACINYPHRIESTIEVPMEAIRKDSSGKGKREVFQFSSAGPRTAWKLQFRFCKGAKEKTYLFCTMIATDLSGLPSGIAIGQLTVVTDEYENKASHLVEVAHVWRVGCKNNSMYLMESDNVPSSLKLTFRLLYANLNLMALLPTKSVCARQFAELKSCDGCRSFVASEVISVFKELDNPDLGLGSALFTPCFGLPKQQVIFVCVLYPRGTVLTPDYVTASIQLVHMPEYLLNWSDGLEAMCGIALDNGHKKFEKTKLKESTIVGWAFSEFPAKAERTEIRVSIRIDIQIPLPETVQKMTENGKAGTMTKVTTAVKEVGEHVKDEMVEKYESVSGSINKHGMKMEGKKNELCDKVEVKEKKMSDRIMETEDSIAEEFKKDKKKAKEELHKRLAFLHSKHEDKMKEIHEEKEKQKEERQAKKAGLRKKLDDEVERLHGLFGIKNKKKHDHHVQDFGKKIGHFFKHRKSSPNNEPKNQSTNHIGSDSSTSASAINDIPQKKWEPDPRLQELKEDEDMHSQF